ncbi:MAG: hypothetical protein M0R80_26655 [Proteobacteria bacterium]|jgi:hypothetical protein|nr:hypothetical protein [Pseudomonadota bacterium]
MITYSICFPYCLRLNLLKNTLESFREQYSYRRDFEICIAEDPNNAKEHIQFLNLIKEYHDLTIITKIGSHRGICYLWNLSVEISHGKYTIITSPEVKPECDILQYLDDAFSQLPQSYQVIAVQNIDASGNHLSWYQHSKLHNRQLHFCAAMSRENWTKLGGMDVDFDAGICYDDDMFLHNIKKAGIQIVCTDTVWASHQAHSHLNWDNRRSILVAKNKQLFQRKTKHV